MEKLIEAAKAQIKPKMHVSFGGGRTVGRLIKAVKEMDITFSSPSESTRQLCAELNIPVLPLDQVTKFDVAFDGCDNLDKNLNVLKSNGGIHTFEKLYANLSDRYIILSPKTRLSDVLNPEVPLCLEVLADAIPQILQKVEQLGGHGHVRQSSDIAGIVRTNNGFGLIDCSFENYENISEINRQLAVMNGVLSTSYFENIVTDALLSDGDEVVHLTK
ncbi:ribose-5-phosphate isomerase A [Companilactobacillus sp. HBUAS56257]|uniref:ribose-5-phosphate isomerase A n=1 Tax=Companilactobacillus sp. HBUAS56257 TaxID=3109360 RepID=UPI002FF0F914